MMSPHEEFIDLMTENAKVNGLDELTSRIMAVLFLSPDEVSLEDIAKSCGYSVSSVCTAMKFIERTGLAKRVKKPKSKKVFFYMKKNLSDYAIDLVEKKYEKIIMTSKVVLPRIINNYKKKKLSAEEKKELRVVEEYYKQILLGEKLLKMILVLVKKKGLKNG